MEKVKLNLSETKKSSPKPPKPFSKVYAKLSKAPSNSEKKTSATQ